MTYLTDERQSQWFQVQAWRREVYLIGALVLVLLAVTGGGCSDDHEKGLAGDWFRCDGVDCNGLSASGIRYRDDGTWVLLLAEGTTLGNSEEYCLEHGRATSQGTYSFDGKILKRIDSDNKVDEVKLELSGDDITETDQATSSYVNLKRISETRSTGFCTTGIPVPDAGVDSFKNPYDGVSPVVLDSKPYFPDF